MKTEFPIVIAYDMEEKKIGCALIQAGMGGTISTFDLQRFGVENWLLAPTSKMELYKIRNEDELEIAIEVTIQSKTWK